MQAYFTSAERIFEYATIPQEVSHWNKVNGETRSPDILHLKGNLQWPQKGTIELKDVVLRYRNNEPVLTYLSFKVLKC